MHHTKSPRGNGAGLRHKKMAALQAAIFCSGQSAVSADSGLANM